MSYDEEFNSWQKKLIAAIFIALVGGNAGFLLNTTTPDETRIDNIDSIQQIILFRIERQEEWHSECKNTVQDHLRSHP